MFGGTLNLSTFAEYGAANSPDADRIMHAMLETDAGYTIMAADVTSEMEYHPPTGFSMSLSGDDGDVLRGYFEKLSTGGPGHRGNAGQQASRYAATASVRLPAANWMSPMSCMITP